MEYNEGTYPLEGKTHVVVEAVDQREMNKISI